ncbi:hypothetical protein CRUP_022106 [Coryphaenoides rupestris]|nr:hypothetical protein CRUP_022106 [Coryphaenoides rupestris]
MDTENHDEDCPKEGHVQGEDVEPMVLKETAANMADPSSPANIAEDPTEATPMKKKKTEPTVEFPKWSVRPIRTTELREEVPEPQRVLESEIVIELGAEQPQPGKEEPKMGDAAPAGQEAGSAECGPELEEVDVPVGTEFIQPVTSFFCSLCQVIYIREEEAKGAHCRSPSHRRMVQAHAASNL